MPLPASVHVGDRFGLLVVVEEAGRARNRERMFRCRCDCGSETVVMSSNLRRGNQKSCGCQRTPPKHGALGTPTYESWRGMIGRCRYPSNASWKNYGARGIKVCERWQGDGGFQNFLADMGERPGGTTLDRVDNEGDYEPGNCRWASWTEQHANKRKRGSGTRL